MDRRYRLMAALGVRNIVGFNKKVREANDASKPIKDPVMMEMASMDPTFDQSTIRISCRCRSSSSSSTSSPTPMMIVGKKVEELIARLAQKARASGIHLDACDSATVGGRHHRSHQGEDTPDAYRVPGLREGGLAHDSRSDGCGRRCSATATCCYSAAGHVDSASLSRRVRVGPGGPSYRERAEDRPAAELHRGCAERAEMAIPGISSDDGDEGVGVSPAATIRTRSTTRRSRSSPRSAKPSILVRAAPTEDRLQPRGATARADGTVRLSWARCNPTARVVLAPPPAGARFPTAPCWQCPDDSTDHTRRVSLARMCLRLGGGEGIEHAARCLLRWAHHAARRLHPERPGCEGKDVDLITGTLVVQRPGKFRWETNAQGRRNDKGSGQLLVAGRQERVVLRPRPRRRSRSSR